MLRSGTSNSETVHPSAAILRDTSAPATSRVRTSITTATRRPFTERAQSAGTFSAAPRSNTTSRGSIRCVFPHSQANVFPKRSSLFIAPAI